MKLFYRVLILLMLINILVNLSVFSQSNTQVNDSTNIDTESLIEKYQNILAYGIDSSVVIALKELINLKLKDLEELVFTRMKETNNSGLMTLGFNYLRAINYNHYDVIEFALEIVSDYQNLPRKSVQYAFFYIKDINEQLNKEQKISLQDIILDITDTDIPAITLPALELIPFIYTEKNIAYIEPQDDASQGDEEWKAKQIEKLYSTKLVQRYHTTNKSVIKDQIMVLLGKIESLNQIDFIIAIIEDENATKSLRYQAIEALAFFDLKEDLNKQSIKLYQKTRGSDDAEIRTATISALTTKYLHEKNESFIDWMKDGLRDNMISVRKQALIAFYKIFEEDANSNAIQDSLFFIIKYMIEHDPETSIQQEAIKTMSLIDSKGHKYLLEKIKNITYLNAAEKTLIDISLFELFDYGGLDALNALAKSNFIKENSSIIEYISQQMVSVENQAIAPLVSTLLVYPDTTVLLNCITTIRKNNLTSYQKDLQAVSDDITKALNVREKAKQIADSF